MLAGSCSAWSLASNRMDRGRTGAGRYILGGEDFGNRILDFCIQDFKCKDRGKGLSGNHRARRRQEMHEGSSAAKADLEHSFTGVHNALRLLRGHHDSNAEALPTVLQQPPRPEHHSQATGAGHTIIGTLEVWEPDSAPDSARARPRRRSRSPTLTGTTTRSGGWST